MKLTELLFELSLGSNDRIHISGKPFELEQRVFKQSHTMKPSGFWYGFGSEWIDWCRDEMPSKWMGNYLYSVDVSRLKILKITSHMELMMFTRKFSSYVNVNGHKGEFGESIDWKDVSNEYDGIEINPYQNEARYQYTWYYPWDVASGCVWHLKNLKIKLLTDKGIDG